MYLGITRYPVILLVCYIEGSIYPPTEPDHQIFLTQITNHQKTPQKNLITKIFMYYERVHNRFHTALWPCRECFTG